MDPKKLDPKTFMQFASARAVNRRAQAIAKRLAKKFKDQRIDLVVSMDGAVPFSQKITEHLYKINPDIDIRFHYVKIKSYHGTSSGKPTVLLPLDAEKLIGGNVVVVEDIIDSGQTITELLNMLPEKIASVTLVAMVNKPHTHTKLSRKVDLIIGFTYHGNDFLVGCGLDYDGRFRQLSAIMIMPRPK